jgi:hypothetical protein
MQRFSMRFDDSVATPPETAMADAPCTGCGKPMGSGDYEVANGKEYHVECFVCCFCQKPFPNGEFTMENDKPCHVKCADANAKPKAPAAAPDICAACNKVIPPGVEMFAVKDATDKSIKRIFHTACFTCSDCGKPIGQKKHAISHGQPVHVECMHGAQQTSGPAAEFAADLKCQRCGEAIKGQKKEVPEFGSFHLTCFRCSVCSLGITKDYFKDPSTGKPRCHRCPP